MTATQLTAPLALVRVTEAVVAAGGTFKVTRAAASRPSFWPTRILSDRQLRPGSSGRRPSARRPGPRCRCFDVYGVDYSVAVDG